MATPIINSAALKDEARRLGFQCCGISPLELVPQEVCRRYDEWLSQGRQGQMHYLENYRAQRRDPSLLLPGVCTIVSLAMSYHPGDASTQCGLAWYAQGKDYHDVLRQRMQLLMQAMGLTGRCFVDTAPVMEKYWAWRGGIGYIGRHTQLVVPHLGSAFFLGELFVTQQADVYDYPITPSPFAHQCGHCHRCQQACPTGALQAHLEGGGTLDARRCLSYLTIEQRDALPHWSRPHLSECFYGCDRCLRACPHLHPTDEPLVSELRASEALLSMTPGDWQHLSREQYQLLFRGSAVKRAKYEGLLRNIAAASQCKPSSDAVVSSSETLQSSSDTVAPSCDNAEA